jgi:predicted DNA-binding transcriptional regulator YafY
MAFNKYATIRYRIIDRCIRSKSHPYPSKEKLRQACEEELYGSSNGEHISISTIEKDLWALKNESSLGYAPIAYDKANNGYFYKDSSFSLDLPLNEEDIELIRLATSTLKQFKNSQVFHDLESAVDKIQGRLNIIGQIDEHEHYNVIRFETAPHYAGSDYLAILLDAVRVKSVLEIRYTPFVDELTREYIVHPYFLQEHKNRWYLICYDTGSDKFRTLGLDRIQQITKTDSSFVPRDDFNPEQYYKYSFGIGIYDGKPVKVVLSFDGIQGKYIKAQPIHLTQKIISEENDQLTVELFIIVSPEFIMYLLGYGPGVQVIEPDSLKKEIIKLHGESLSRYR